MTAPTFAATLRDYRERAGISQNRLAARSSFDKSMVSRYESGSRMPSRRAINDLARALMLTADEEIVLRSSVFGAVAPEMDPLALRIDQALRNHRECRQFLACTLDAAIAQVERLEAGE